MPNGVMADVYDGVVWNSFLTDDGKDFLILDIALA